MADRDVPADPATDDSALSQDQFGKLTFPSFSLAPSKHLPFELHHMRLP